MSRATPSPPAERGTLRLDTDFLRKLEQLQIVSRRAFTGQNHGERLARRRGHGLEFADHRAYTPGDDFRRIDWNVYKRLNRLLLRLFDEELELPVYLFLDASGSMATPAKFDQARRVAAALCYIGLSNFDQVTLAAFSDSLGHEIASGRGKGRIFQVFEQLEGMTAGGPTDLTSAFRMFANRPRRRGVAVVISDFLDPAGYETGLTTLGVLGHDVFVVHIISPGDAACGLGDIRFIDAETQETRDIEVTPALAAAYARAWAAHAADLEAFCDRLRFAYLPADTSHPFEDIVLGAFRQGGFLA